MNPKQQLTTSAPIKPATPTNAATPTSSTAPAQSTSALAWQRTEPKPTTAPQNHVSAQVQQLQQQLGASSSIRQNSTSAPTSMKPGVQYQAKPAPQNPQPQQKPQVQQSQQLQQLTGQPQGYQAPQGTINQRVQQTQQQFAAQTAAEKAQQGPTLQQQLAAAKQKAEQLGAPQVSTQPKPQIPAQPTPQAQSQPAQPAPQPQQQPAQKQPQQQQQPQQPQQAPKTDPNKGEAPAAPRGASTQGTLLISELRDGLVIMKDGSFRAVVACQSINFDLMSEVEREGIEYSYQNFLNSLTFTTQILIRSQRIDLSPYLDRLSKLRKNNDNMLLGVLMDDYIQFIDELSQEANIMDKAFFIVIPYYSDSSTEQAVQKAKGLFGNKEAEAVTKIDRPTYDKAITEINNRIEAVVAGLFQIGIHAVRLNTRELAALYYNFNNPDTAVREPLVDFEKLATTYVKKGPNPNTQNATTPNLPPAQNPNLTNT